MCGDFDEILYASEKKGGEARVESRMEMFHEALISCNLVDVRYSSSWFTWERGNSMETNIRETLDRGVANDLWLGMFLDMGLYHLPTLVFDHCPFLLDLNCSINPNRYNNFRFEGWWMMEDSFEREVSTIWNSASGDILSKLDTLRGGLTRWV